jgi:hypothetical protein
LVHLLRAQGAISVREFLIDKESRMAQFELLILDDVFKKLFVHGRLGKE